MGLSGNGGGWLGGGAEGFEVANSGTVRRAPGEGPKVNGGRSQSQEMDSYDQPQYEAEDKVSSDDVKSSEEDWSERIPGGLAAGKRPQDFDLERLTQGVNVELEHTSDVQTAIEIAMDHLEEDPRYYDKLADMEQSEGKEMAKITLKEFFNIAEAPVYDKTDDGWQERGTGKVSKGLPGGSSYSRKAGEVFTGPEASAEWEKDHPRPPGQKPPLEQAAGKFLHVAQHSKGPTPYEVQQDNLTYDDLDPQMFDGRNVVLKDSGRTAWGFCSFQVGPGGELKFYGDNWDTSG